MEGVFFLLSVIAVGLIMWWVIQNDKVGPTEATHGLLAMDDAPADEKAKAVTSTEGERTGTRTQRPGVTGRLPRS